MGRWDDSGIWVGEELRQEAFFFPSGGVNLYASLYGPPAAEPGLGVVFCRSWGYEADLANHLLHAVSIELARAGGVALNFHYPGSGDSDGNAEETTLDLMTSATVDAVAEAARRYPEVDWILAGLMLGASVAALATARDAGVEQLLLVQPALRPGRYFKRLERIARRSLGGPAPAPAQGYASGYRLPQPLLESAERAESAVAEAISGFPGDGIVIRHERPSIDGISERFEQVLVPDAWRFGAADHSSLARASSDWLRPQAEVPA